MTEPEGEPSGRPSVEELALAEQVVALPKVLLHDHLDGGVRAATIVEIAARDGHELPAADADGLAAWFVAAASSGSLEQYLTTFEHTVAVMQTADDLRRVAREAALDLAEDGVVYAEQRYAPEQHQRLGLSLDEVVAAVQQGFAEGSAEAAAQGRPIRIGTVLSAMRQADRAEEIAELALQHRNDGVVAFDIAGPEAGFPPSRLRAAFDRLRDASFPVTVHAGEAAGLDSIAEAVHVAGACRLGHGARLVDDVAEDELGDRLGDLAHWVRDRRIALELCPSSNLQTGIAGTVAEHPATRLHRLGFAVTVNTDNRLQSGTSLSRELMLLVQEAGWTLADVEQVTLTAAEHAFIHHDERAALVDTVIRPAFAAVRGGRHRA